ncbi:MAG: fibronectin type III domain-containing protein [Eubacterium sp.]
MKKIISILLSAIMLTTVTAEIDFSAYAGSYDTVGTARQYNIGTSITGYFSNNDAVDYVKFTLNESGIVSFTFSGSDSYNVRILGSDNSSNIHYESIDYNDNLGYAYREDYCRLTAGVYYLKVTAGYINNNYTISSSFTSANESFYESRTQDNNTIPKATGIELNTGYTGQIGYGDDTDFYSFTVTEGTYIVYIKSDEDVKCSFWNTNGEIIGHYCNIDVNESIGYAEHSESISLSAGTYCFKVSGKWNYGANYSFSISAPHQHAYGYAYTVAPTYTAQGYDVYTCSCGNSYYTNYKPVKKLSKVTLSSVKATGKKKIKVSWKKKSGASGYQIYWAKDKSFKKVVAKTIVKGGKTTSYTGKNFTKGKKYYVKVRAYKTVNGKKVYGSWSTVKSVKCK